MTGVVRDEAGVRFVDPAEASQVYAKGFFGTPGSEGSLELDRYESVYLLEMERIAVATEANLLR